MPRERKAAPPPHKPRCPSSSKGSFSSSSLPAPGIPDKRNETHRCLQHFSLPIKIKGYIATALSKRDVLSPAVQGKCCCTSSQTFSLLLSLRARPQRTGPQGGTGKDKALQAATADPNKEHPTHHCLQLTAFLGALWTMAEGCPLLPHASSSSCRQSS